MKLTYDIKLGAFLNNVEFALQHHRCSLLIMVVFPLYLKLMGRYGTLEEVGLVCLFLAADATFCTGININVTGGAELDYGKKSRHDKQ